MSIRQRFRSTFNVWIRVLKKKVFFHLSDGSLPVAFTRPYASSPSPPLNGVGFGDPVRVQRRNPPFRTVRLPSLVSRINHVDNIVDRDGSLRDVRGQDDFPAVRRHRVKHAVLLRQRDQRVQRQDAVAIGPVEAVHDSRFHGLDLLPTG